MEKVGDETLKTSSSSQIFEIKVVFPAPKLPLNKKTECLSKSDMILFAGIFNSSNEYILYSSSNYFLCST